jgi:hypothetical protein
MDGVKKINEYLLKDGRTLVMTQFNSDTSTLAPGTIFLDPTSGGLKYIHLAGDGTKIWNTFDMSDLFEDGTFDSALIQDNSLHAAKLVDLSISPDKIIDAGITTIKIADKAITDSKFELNCIDADKIKDNTIITSKICDNSITGDKIFNGAITTNKITPKNITLELLADDSVSADQIVDASITGDKIVAKTILNGLIADNAILANNIGVKEVKTIHLDNLCITAEKIATGAVSGNKIPNYAIKDSHIEAVDGFKILDNSILSSKIKNNNITTNLIADGAVSITKLNASTQLLINNSIKIQPIVVVDNQERYNTALINGNVVMKSTDGTKVNLEVNGDIKSTGDITGARVFNPWFADIAEAYIPTCDLQPGDPVSLCEEGGLKVTKYDEANSKRFLGFVSNEYATLFGADRDDVDSGRMVAVTLVGRIKCKLGTEVSGKVGNYVNIFNLNGEHVTFVTTHHKTDHSVGRLLEDKTHDQEYALCQLWP